MTLLFRSASKQREWLYELGLFTAWHVAAFNSSAKAGKLHDYAYYRDRLLGSSRRRVDTPRPSWQEQKAARKRQMEQFRKHQQRRTAPVKPKVKRRT
jgi:hypothetical protein